MAKIQVKIEYPIKDGTSFTFHAPCNCSAVDGLTVTHPHGKTDFVFKDAHGNDLTGINNLFVRGSLIQAVLDVTKGAVFLQNADTNAYLENQIGVERARINELLAMRESGDSAELSFEGDCFRAHITSNGVAAYLWLEATGLTDGQETGKYVAGTYDIPIDFAPLGNIYADGTFGTDLRLKIIVVSTNTDTGTRTVRVSFEQSTAIEQGAEETFEVFYPLASPSIPELTDIRIGHDGVTHNTAGSAVRGQFADAIGSIVPALDEMDARIKDIEENGGANITVDDKMDYNSTNPVQNGVVYAEIANIGGMASLAQGAAGAAAQFAQEAVDTANIAMGRVDGLSSNMHDFAQRLSALETTTGDIDTALDNIIAMQETLITGTTGLTVAEEESF